MNGLHRLAGIVALLVLAGCGSDAGDETAGTSARDPEAAVTTTVAGDGCSEPTGELDVCAMLDADEVADVLGEAAKATDQSTGDLYGCSWEGASDALNVLSVSIYVHPDEATAKEQYDATKEGLDGSDIMGLGDEASYSEPFGLEVLSGRYDISVDNTGPTEKESDLTVANRVLEQLP